MNTAPAGWYASPGEPGLARYWTGLVWTEARQPLPPAVGTAPLTIPAPSAVPSRGFGPYLPSTASMPYATPQPAQANAVVGQTLALVETVVGGGRRRGAIGSAVATMFFGALWLALSLGITQAITQGDSRPGDVTTSGTVTAVASYIDGQNHRMCSPKAEFVVGGVTYAAAGAGSSSSCPRVGSEVTVTYDPANPESTGRIAAPGWLKIFTWGFPAIGVLVILSGVWTLIRRAASKVAGAIG